ncbi:MAG: hypothetical protein GEU82_04475 [Luteitalea sp.]|nr:hypothetical protein [Luteitalea sp.]
MPDSIKTILASAGVLNHVILPTGIDLTLAGLEIDLGPNHLGGGISTGTVQLKKDLSKSPIPGFDFSLTVPSGIVKSAPYKLKLDPPAGAPTSFQFWLLLADQQQALFVFKFVKGVPGSLLTGATKSVDANGTVVLDVLPAADPKSAPYLVSRSPEAGAALGPALLIAGSAGAPASMRFTPDTDSTTGVIELGLEPPTVVFGSSRIGFDCPVIVIDDSEVAKGAGAGAPALNPPLASIDADDVAWRGILARQFDFYLPADVPLFGGRSIKAFFAIGRGSGGTELVIESTVPARAATPTQGGRPGYSMRIECMDPTAAGLSALVPTLISATMELPLDQAAAGFSGSDGASRDLTFAAGKPVRVTATFARDPANSPGQFKLSIGVAAQGPDGLISVTSSGMGGAKIFNTAAALATALIADQDVERKADVGDTKGVVLYGLLAAGAALSSLFTDDSRFTLHGAEIESSGHGSPVGGRIALTLDYSVAVRVTEVSVGVLSVSMRPDQPMRIRVRKARMSIDPGKSGLDMVGLDFGRADMEIENPGAWNVEGLESLFDVLGSRSGRGSSWIEVDLRFKLNLGPIKVSGATIRATLNGDGSIDASIRGLEAGLSIPGAIDATGGLQLVAGGFSANLRAKLLPLNLAADAGVIYAPPMIVLRLAVDLPAPIPLANSGFGLLGIGGLLGFSAVPDYGAAADPDPVLRQLRWTPDNEHSFKQAQGQSTFGLFAAVGTLPDAGFSFSAKAGVLISVPDIAVRGSLNGKVLQPAVKIGDPSYPPSAGISFLGFIAVDADALSFGLLGKVDLKPLLEIQVPLAGHFPFRNDASDWYVYLGADGSAHQGRSIGPISARVLPDILDVGADAYLMLRGKGIEAWPNGRALPSGPLTLDDGFVVAFGFSVQNTFGVEPIVWAEIYASLDLLVGAKPPTLAGFGRAGGSLNLGPFSLGVQAQVSFLLSEGRQYFWAEVSGKIELFFFDIEGKVTIAFGDEPDLALPTPDLHPLDRLGADGVRAGSLGVLTDDSYRVVAPLVEDPALITDDMMVWPDTLISLPFAISPVIAPSATTQFPAVGGPGATPPPGKVGSEMLHYNWRLDELALVDVTGEADPFAGAGTRPAGQLASRWQAPRADSGGGDVSELVLFSTSPDLWINRLADNGAGLAANPLEQSANLCRLAVSAKAGWAVGFLAGQEPDGFRLPPDPVSAQPLVSRVEAHLHHFGLAATGQGTSLDRVFTLPQPFSLEPALLAAWPQPKDVERKFAGHLVAPSLGWLIGRDIRDLLRDGLAFAGQQVRLDLVEAIVNGLLVLVAERDLYNIRENFFGLRVFDDTGAEWTRTEMVDIPTAQAAAVFRPPVDHAVQQLIVNFPIGRRVGVVGIGGVTLSARAAAAAENQAIAGEVARQAAAAAGPKIDPSSNTPHQRAILDPGRIYRIDVDMVWAGEICRQNESGQQVSVAKADFGQPQTHAYLPKGQGAPHASIDGKSYATRRRLFFKTTPKPVGPTPVKYGAKMFGHWLTAQQDVFQPEMLQRYLSGYDPAQSEQFRFYADPLRAHFRQDHVAALAKAYDFDLMVAVRRVDRPGAADASPELLAATWTAATDKAFLTETDQVRHAYAAASPCTIPTPGATATVTPALEPEGWYEIYAVAKSSTPAFADGRLPGVTFKTSRWPSPQDMWLGLGFSIGGLPVPAAAPTGDVIVNAAAGLAPAVIEDNDQAFLNAVLALGLDGWPVAEAPRLSRLWVAGANGAWLFAGLMVESPEPIHRAGRLDLVGLGLEMGQSGTAIKFDIRRRDRSGARLIYLTATPFLVVTRERIVPPIPRQVPFRNVTPTLVLKSRSTVLATVTDISASLVIPAAPGFSEDP